MTIKKGDEVNSIRNPKIISIVDTVYESILNNESMYVLENGCQFLKKEIELTDNNQSI